MKESNSQFIISCEHGGNHIPAAYQMLFKNHMRLLSSHNGYDKGALGVARKLSKRLLAPLVYSITSRLLVDLNRSLHNPNLFSGITRYCDESDKKEIINRYYLPYHARMEKSVNDAIGQKKQIFHFSIHSFTPVYNGEVRNADIGILYNPSRKIEKKLAGRLQAYIRKHSGYRVRLNYPYLGKADGLTTILRKKYPMEHYCGIEIELNQRFFFERSDDNIKAIVDMLHNAFVRCGV